MLKERLLHFEHATLKFLRVGKTSKYSRQKNSKKLYKPYQCQRMLWIYQSFPQIQTFKKNHDQAIN